MCAAARFFDDENIYKGGVFARCECIIKKERNSSDAAS